MSPKRAFPMAAIIPSLATSSSKASAFSNTSRWRRANETLARAVALLEEVAQDGLMRAIGKARFGDVARGEDGGKGLGGVVERSPAYFNPFLEILEEAAA